jgi:hypothetical protein
VPHIVKHKRSLRRSQESEFKSQNEDAGGAVSELRLLLEEIG